MRIRRVPLHPAHFTGLTAPRTRPCNGTVDQAEAKRYKQCWRNVDEVIDENIPHVLIGGLAVSQLSKPRLTADIDVLTVLDDDSHIPSLIENAGDLQLPLPSVEDLIILKAVAHRAVDLQDIMALAQAHPRLDRRRIERSLLHPCCPIMVRAGITKGMCHCCSRETAFFSVSYPGSQADQAPDDMFTAAM